MSKAITDRIIELVAERLDVPVENVKPQTRLKEDLSADSLAVAELGMALEEMFELEVTDDAVFDQVKTVQDAVDLVVKHGRNA